MTDPQEAIVPSGVHTQRNRAQALSIWQAGVESVKPERCLRDWFRDGRIVGLDLSPLPSFDHILVVGAGKAGAAMSQVLEQILTEQGVDPRRVRGIVNVPNETVIPLQSIRLHPSRPAGVNHPTASGVEGARAILQLVQEA